jgi:PhnB protein
MARINPYLTFNGNCEEAFTFYKSIFGGEWMMMKFKDAPPMPGMPESANNLVMHVSLPISKETSLMGSDANPTMGKVNIGQHMSLSIVVDSKEEATRVFKALSSGGKITMPIADMFWGAYFGMLEDKYGFTWMVNYDYPKK